MWANRKNPRTACIIVSTEESISPRLAELADVELDVSALDPDQRVQPVALAPGEPAPQLVGVQVVGVPGVAGQERDRRQLGRRSSFGWNGRRVVCDMEPLNGLSTGRTRGPPHERAPLQELSPKRRHGDPAK